LGRAVEQGGDLVERHREHVVQDEGDAFGGGQCVQDDLQRHSDRVREQRLVFGVFAGCGGDERFDPPWVCWRLG